MFARVQSGWAAVALTVVLSLLGGVVWLVRLEGRVNAQARDIVAVQQASEAVREDLKYIRERIDRALDGASR